jgi:geranylgeranyl diphosphate synthase, type II
MYSFKELTALFSRHFATNHFPSEPKNLYEPNSYFLSLGGKHIRPVAVLMANELFGSIKQDAYHIGTAIELFHNFSLIHDDIMDNANLRRGKPTVHVHYGVNTAILAGDVMLVKAYEYLNNVQPSYHKAILQLFNTTATQVCEGQQLDMDFSTTPIVAMDDYIHMIALKTSVLIAAAFAMGAIIGDASQGNVDHLYQFGKNLGIAFQIQDDYLDCFGTEEKVGKKIGGDIMENKKTFLWLYAYENANTADKKIIDDYITNNTDDKITIMKEIFDRSGAKQWTVNLQETYFNKALQHLEDTAVLSARKEHIKGLAEFLLQRDF